MFKIGHFTKYLTAPGLLGPVSIKALLVKIQISPSQFQFALSVRDHLSGILMGSPDVEPGNLLIVNFQWISLYLLYCPSLEVFRIVQIK